MVDLGPQEEVEGKDQVKKHDSPGFTTLYLSGSSYKGELYVLAHRKRLPHVGILLSYYDMKTMRGTTFKRLVNLKGK